MLKKITIEQLRPGMYVERVDRPWLEIPFFRRAIHSPGQIERLHEHGIRELHINTARSKVTPGPGSGQIARGEQRAYLADPRPELIPLVMPELAEIAADFRACVDQGVEVMEEARSSVRSIFDSARNARRVPLGLARKVTARIIDTFLENEDTLLALCMLEQHDRHTYQHAVRVSILTVASCHFLNWTRRQLEAAGMAGLLHDIGKVRVPGHILNKPDGLCADEIKIMRRHPSWGEDILRGQGGIPPEVFAIVAQHHERYGGGGYPSNLSGTGIALEANLVAAADTFEALNTDRVYRKALNPRACIRLMETDFTLHFYPGLLSQFIKCLGTYPVSTPVRLNTGETGVVIGVNRRSLDFPRVLLVRDAHGAEIEGNRVVDLYRNNDNAGEEVVSIVEALDARREGIDVKHRLMAGPSPGRPAGLAARAYSS